MYIREVYDLQYHCGIKLNETGLTHLCEFPTFKVIHSMLTKFLQSIDVQVFLFVPQHTSVLDAAITENV